MGFEVLTSQNAGLKYRKSQNPVKEITIYFSGTPDGVGYHAPLLDRYSPVNDHFRSNAPSSYLTWNTLIFVEKIPRGIIYRISNLHFYYPCPAVLTYTSRVEWPFCPLFCAPVALASSRCLHPRLSPNCLMSPEIGDLHEWEKMVKLRQLRCD